MMWVAGIYVMGFLAVMAFAAYREASGSKRDLLGIYPWPFVAVAWPIVVVTEGSSMLGSALWRWMVATAARFIAWRAVPVTAPEPPPVDAGPYRTTPCETCGK